MSQADTDRLVVKALVNTPAMHPEVLKAMAGAGLRALARVRTRRVSRSLRLRALHLWESGQPKRLPRA